jgi:hypothetical protein
MSTPLIILIGIVGFFLIVSKTTKGTNRLLILAGSVAGITLGVLFWTGRIALSDIVDAMHDLFNVILGAAVVLAL